MGKERMPADQKRSVLTATTLRPKEREQLDLLVAARGVSVATVLRKMILRDLRRAAAQQEKQ